MPWIAHWMERWGLHLNNKKSGLMIDPKFIGVKKNQETLQTLTEKEMATRSLFSVTDVP